MDVPLRKLLEICEILLVDLLCLEFLQRVAEGLCVLREVLDLRPALIRYDAQLFVQQVDFLLDLLLGRVDALRALHQLLPQLVDLLRQVVLVVVLVHVKLFQRVFQLHGLVEDNLHAVLGGKE